MTTDIALLNGDQFTDQELQVFEEKYLAVMQNLADMTLQKKRLEEAEKKIKGQLQKVMDEYRIKSIDNQFLRITRVAGSEGTTVLDVDALAEKEPKLYKELLADYPKISGKKKGSVRFETKGK